MDLSIIIVNYNGEEYLSDCIDSIKKYCHDVSYEIIIWDNHSSDNSVVLIEKRYSKDVVLIKSKENLGFAGGNNAAAKHAIGEHVLLLNNDTILMAKPSIPIEVLSNPSVGVVSMKMLGRDGEYRFSAGNFPSPLRLIKLSWLFRQNGGFKDGQFNADEPLEVDWVEGSFLLTRMKIWRQLDGLDESYFMYAEDIDFCKRVSDLSYKTLYLPINGYVHYGGYGKERQHMLFSSLNIYIQKHTSGVNKHLHKLALNINLLIKNVKALIKKAVGKER